MEEEEDVGVGDDDDDGDDAEVRDCLTDVQLNEEEGRSRK